METLFSLHMTNVPMSNEARQSTQYLGKWMITSPKATQKGSTKFVGNSLDCLVYQALLRTYMCTTLYDIHAMQVYIQFSTQCSPSMSLPTSHSYLPIPRCIYTLTHPWQVDTCRPYG